LSPGRIPADNRTTGIPEWLWLFCPAIVHPKLSNASAWSTTTAYAPHSAETERTFIFILRDAPAKGVDF
jgi:hypothetical protein